MSYIQRLELLKLLDMIHRFTLLWMLFLCSSLSIIYAQSGKTHFDGKQYVPGEFLIQLTNERSFKLLLENAPSEFNLQLKDYVSPPMRTWLITFDAEVMSHEQMQDWLYSQKDVTIVDYNYFLELRSTVPNDPSFGTQWHHVNTGQTGGTPDADIDSDLAWEITTGGRTATNDDIVVCMIESGNLDHPDLSPNRWVNAQEIPGNGIDDDGNGYVDDYNGWNPVAGNDAYGTGSHGTNCLGMIGAKGDNNLNVVGANWDVKMMVIGGYSLNTQATVIAAYTYPLVMRKLWNQTNGERGAFVVATSASWGLDQANPTNYPLWCQFYDTLGYHGILNIGATTNSNLNVDNVGDMPTACSSDYMIGVGRTDHNDNTAGGYGQTTIYLGAPGINVVTTAGSNGITTTTGTSFSCPLTAGVVALAYSIPCPSFMNIVRSNPRMGADLVRSALINGVDVKTQLQSKFITGGRLNAKNTLDLLMAETCSSCNAMVESSSVENSAATISYSSEEEVTSVEIKYREQGATAWSTVTGVNGVAQITGIQDCKVYEYYLVSTCPEEINEGTIQTFISNGCGACIDNSYCTTKATRSTTSRLAFTNNSTSLATETTTVTQASGWGGSIANGYNYGSLVIMKGTGANPNEGCGTITNAAELAGNIAVVVRGTCEFSIKALSAQNAGATALIIVNNAAGTATMGPGANGANINIPVVMVSNTMQGSLLDALDNGQSLSGLLGVQREWIESFTVNGETFVTGDNNGYIAPEIGIGQPLYKGQNIPFTITAGFSNQVLPELSRIWVDLNQDGDFTADELVFTQSTPSTTAVTNGSFTIPTNALEGNSRLRVQMAYKGAGQEGTPSVCGNYTWGEVEDYCIDIKLNDLSIDQVKSKPWNVFPNPSNGLVHFTWNDQTFNGKINWFDLSGRWMESHSVSGAHTTVNIKHFSPGTYFYQIVDSQNGQVQNGKLVIE